MSEMASSSAPHTASTASAASMPRITDLGRGGTRPASLRQGARLRAAPNPLASSAMRNPIMTACHSEGAATEVRSPRRPRR